MHFFSDILKTDTLPDVKEVIESIQGYDWHISTKYYTADVLLCTAKERTIGDRSFAESVEAFIAYFTADQVSSEYTNLIFEQAGQSDQGFHDSTYEEYSDKYFFYFSIETYALDTH